MLSFFFLLACFCLTQVLSRCHLQPFSLLTEGQTNPFTDQKVPRFSWKLQDLFSSPNQHQISYRIRCSSISSTGPPDLWDSFTVKSNHSFAIVYEGVKLNSLQKAYWSVEVEATDGSTCVSSEKAWFETTLLDGFLSSTKWLTAEKDFPKETCDYYQNKSAQMFRYQFTRTSSAPLLGARLFITGLGFYEAYIEGHRVGEAWLDPGPSNYALQTYYSAFDVTSLLNSSSSSSNQQHAIGVILGNGWFNPLPMLFWGSLNLRDSLTVGEQPIFLCEMHLEYADNSTQVVVTNDEWKTGGNSSIVRNDLYLGVLHDARLMDVEQQPKRREKTSGIGKKMVSEEAKGTSVVVVGNARREEGEETEKDTEDKCWSCVNYNDSLWKNVYVNTTWNPPLSLSFIPPIILSKEIYTPVSITQPDTKNPYLYLVDFGQNIAGIVNFTQLFGLSGSFVTMRYGEILWPNGTLNVMTSVAGQIKKPGMGGECAPNLAEQRDVFILAGNPEGESFIPHFTWHGFQYVEVDMSQLINKTLTSDMLRARAIHTAVNSSGTFFSSDSLLNDIQKMFVITLRNNLQGSQSDCPHRERFGYGGDLLAISESGMLNYDMSQLYALRVAEYTRDAIEGVFTETSPNAGMHDAGVGRLGGPIGWGSVQPQLAVRLYRHYGDVQTIKNAYFPALKYVQILEANMNEVRAGLSDWNGVEISPVPLTGLGFLYSNYNDIVVMANLMNDSLTAKTYAQKAQILASEINAEFLNETTGVYAGTNPGGANWSATQCAQSMALFLGLAPESVEDKVLARLLDNVKASDNHLGTGMFGIRWLLLSLCDRGYCDVAYSIASQQTYPSYGYMLASNATSMWESWYYSNNTQSHNHAMFGSVSQFFFSSLAGIRPAPDAIAFSPLWIVPNFVKELSFVNATYNSIRGPIAVLWECPQDCSLITSSPPNVETFVKIPASFNLTCVQCDGWNKSVSAGMTTFTGNGVLSVKFSR